MSNENHGKLRLLTVLILTGIDLLLVALLWALLAAMPDIEDLQVLICMYLGLGTVLVLMAIGPSFLLFRLAPRFLFVLMTLSLGMLSLLFLDMHLAAEFAMRHHAEEAVEKGLFCFGTGLGGSAVFVAIIVAVCRRLKGARHGSS